MSGRLLAFVGLFVPSFSISQTGHVVIVPWLCGCVNPTKNSEFSMVSLTRLGVTRAQLNIQECGEAQS